MPKVKHYSASWLSKNAPGHQLFEPSQDATRSRALSPPYSSKKKFSPGPRRTIARRGTEVFVAVGKEIRWADLAYLKDDWAAGQATRGRQGGVRIKREESLQSLEETTEEPALGMRVSASKVARDWTRES